MNCVHNVYIQLTKGLVAGISIVLIVYCYVNGEITGILSEHIRIICVTIDFYSQYQNGHRL